TAGQRRDSSAERLLERHLRRHIHYRWISRHNTVHLFTIRQPTEDHPESSERLWRTNREPANVHVKGAPGPPPKQQLLERARDIIRRTHYSIRTAHASLNWRRRYILFHPKRHPQEMGLAEIEAFLTHLAIAGTVAHSTQNQACNALLLLSREVLGLSLDDAGITA